MTTPPGLDPRSTAANWKQGPNAFVLELTSPDGKPLDGGKATLSTSMAMGAWRR